MKPSRLCPPPALPSVKETPRKKTRKAGERICSMEWSDDLEERLSLCNTGWNFLQLPTTIRDITEMLLQNNMLP